MNARLFDLPPVFSGRSRRGDPETSREAARSITGRTEQRIMDAFRAAPHGLTDDELAAALGHNVVYPSTVKTARSRLSKQGLLVAAGEGLSNRGRRMTKWALAVSTGKE